MCLYHYCYNTIRTLLLSYIVLQAVGRLGGKVLLDECNSLRTKTLDQSNQEIIREINQASKEMQETKREVDTLKMSFNSLKINYTDLNHDHKELIEDYGTLRTDHERMNNAVVELRQTYDDTLPRGLRGISFSKSCTLTAYIFLNMKPIPMVTSC